VLKSLISRRTLTVVADAVRSVVNPAALVEAQQPTTAPDPTGLYEADEMPPVADIERAALGYDLACDNARRADRSKRAAKKVLDKLPTGIYGRYRIFRAPSSRMTVDLEAVTATYKKLGIGPVPMKACAPSLKVERLADVEPTAAAAELVAA